MATSPNYAWAEPDNSSLVKNGAADIRTLGDAIDTSVWNVGFGQAGKNKFINGNFGIWQRGTSFDITAVGYTADRFLIGNIGNTGTVTQQAFTAGAAPVAGYESQYFLRANVVGVAGAGNFATLNQRIEDVRSLAGQTVTISYWAKADAAKSVSLEFQQFFGSGGSANVNTSAGKQALTTSWARYSATVTIPSISGKTLVGTTYLDFRFFLTAGSNFDARTSTLGTQSIIFDVWGVQVEYGSKATPFQLAGGGDPQSELAMCQRYFERMVNGADNSSETIGVFQCFSTTQGYGTLRFVVPKRATPSMTFSGNADFVVKDASGTNRATTLMATGTYSPRTANVTFTIGTASLLAGSAAWMLANSATATIDVSAEL
jgi:hypothetical protein